MKTNKITGKRTGKRTRYSNICKRLRGLREIGECPYKVIDSINVIYNKI